MLRTGRCRTDRDKRSRIETRAALGGARVAALAILPTSSTFKDDCDTSVFFLKEDCADANRIEEGFDGSLAAARASPWAAELLRCVLDKKEAVMHECRLVAATLESTGTLAAVANYDTLVLCHDAASSFDTDQARLDALRDAVLSVPAALKDRGWRRVLHLCEPHADQLPQLADALLNDLCSWRHALHLDEPLCPKRATVTLSGHASLKRRKDAGPSLFNSEI